MAKRPTKDRDDQPTIPEPTPERSARAAPGRPARDRHLPGDDRSPPGRAREERQCPQRGRRRRRADRARDPAPARAGGHRVHRPSSTRWAPWRRLPRSSSSRTAPSGRSSKGRRACASSTSSPTIRTSGQRSRSSTDDSTTGLEIQALMRTVQAQIEQYVANGAPVPPEAAVAARNITEPGLLADMVAYSPDMSHRAAPGAPRDGRRHRAPEARRATSSPARSRSSS